MKILFKKTKKYHHEMFLLQQNGGYSNGFRLYSQFVSFGAILLGIFFADETHNCCTIKMQLYFFGLFFRFIFFVVERFTRRIQMMVDD